MLVLVIRVCHFSTSLISALDRRHQDAKGMQNFLSGLICLLCITIYRNDEWSMYIKSLALEWPKHILPSGTLVEGEESRISVQDLGISFLSISLSLSINYPSTWDFPLVYASLFSLAVYPLFQRCFYLRD